MICNVFFMNKNYHYPVSASVSCISQYPNNATRKPIFGELDGHNVYSQYPNNANQPSESLMVTMFTVSILTTQTNLRRAWWSQCCRGAGTGCLWSRPWSRVSKPSLVVLPCCLCGTFPEPPTFARAARSKNSRVRLGYGSVRLGG